MIDTKSTERIAQILVNLRIHFSLALPEIAPDFEYSHIIVSCNQDENIDIPEWIVLSTCPVLTVGNFTKKVLTWMGGEITQTGNRGIIEVDKKCHRIKNNNDLIVKCPLDFTVTSTDEKNNPMTVRNSRWCCTLLSPESEQASDPYFFRKFVYPMDNLQ